MWIELDPKDLDAFLEKLKPKDRNIWCAGRWDYRENRREIVFYFSQRIPSFC